MLIKTFIVLSAAATLVSAHGYVDKLSIGGKDYTGYQINSDPYSSPIPERIVRAVKGNGPIMDVTSIDLQCGGVNGSGTEPAKLEADAAAAGSNVTIIWTKWPDSHVGPTVTYMAKCPDTGCTSYSPGTEAVWFKVAEMGRIVSSNTWGSTQLMTAPYAYTYTIPSCLAAGHYLVRHETIALHSAGSYPGAQFYPSCHQLQVSGSGTSSGPSNLVAFPGAYAATDAGITYDGVYGDPVKYPCPGPALFTC